MPKFYTALLLSSLVLATGTIEAAENLPRFDLNPTCRGATRQEVIGKSQTERAARETCLKKENEAHNHLQQNWASFPAEHRASCVRTTSAGGIPSYVQLQSCLETRRDADKIPRDGGAVTTGRGNPQ